jgi:hypothetical protein
MEAPFYKSQLLHEIALHAKNFMKGDEDGKMLSKLISEFERNFYELREEREI